MTTHKSWMVGGIVMLSLLLTGAGVGATMAGPDATSVLSAPAQAQTQSVTVLINEVMPKEDTGEYEWVELKIGGVYRVYLPLVLRSSAGGALSGRSSSEPARVAAAGADLSGYQVTDEDGNTFDIPGELPPVPPGAFVLIVFGAGTDDYDFSDGRATLYTGAALANSLADGGDQVALYAGGDHSADTIVDFVAWTIEPGSDAANAAAAGIWQPDWFDTFESGFGDTSDDDILEPDESLGRYPGGEGKVGPQAFALYHDGQLSPGQANPVPLPSFFTPEDGAVVETEGFSVSWSPVPGATGYRFQLDDDVAFNSPLHDAVISESYYQPPTPLAEGTYYWQVQPLGPQGEESAWLGPIEIGIVVFAGGVSAQAEVVLGITPVRQNKDSQLICLDGCPEGDPTTNARENAWDAPAPCTAPPCTNNTKYEHGRMYCVPASIRMMASHYGGDLKMDRIAYHMAQEWTGNTLPGTNDNNPNNDLAHNKGWQYHSEEDEGISWALGTTLTATGGKPSFSDIKSWIDAGRPIMFRNPGHMMVMDGYREEDGDQYIHVLDPDQPPDCWRWQDYSTQTIDGHWPGPASAPSVRSDEASVSTDTDGDGIMDFDEINRFPIGYTSADSDDDWVRDKQDMREYVFNSAGNFSYRNADWDGDGDRKEVDCDNDGDGSPDGCEDVDGDGILDAGETDNFDAGDSQACVPTFEIAYPTHRYTLSAGAHNNPDKILIHLRVDAPDCWGLSLSPEDFDVTVGTQAAPDPIVGYTVGDEYWILVQAPGQEVADHYNLEITYDSALTDSQERAIYYLPRLASDQVLVVDVSGSMSGYDKLFSAQNAARLFVDQWTTGDMIGAVAFSSTVGVPYPLREITTIGAGGEQEAAKDEIDDLTSAGTTAMGSGLLEGQDQLDARGDASHEHTMVLLGDGMENESPYWTDASVHDAIVDAGTIVHVVGLGPPTAAWYDRLEDVADETGGEFWPVDESVTVSALSTEAAASSPFVSALPNRLADAYKSAAEIAGRLQRLWEAKGMLNIEEPRTVSYEVKVERGLGEALFSVNWDNPNSTIVLSLKDPDGDPVTDASRKVIRHTDRTHDQYRIQAPEGGVWVVTLTYVRGKMEAEYLAILAAPSETTMGFQLGLSPEDRVPGAEMPMIAYLADRKPITRGEVRVTISMPNNEYTERELFDDGEHGDGKAEDGVYANVFNLPQPGVYRLKVRGEGEDNEGQYFIRRLTRSFSVRPRVVYIYGDDLSTAGTYRALLEGHGLGVDLLSVDAIPSTSLWVYDLIIVGPETGSSGDWHPARAVAAIEKSGKPVIGLGFGGSSLFSELGLFIDWGQGWIGTDSGVYAINMFHEIWSTPYPIPLSRKDRVVPLYERDSWRIAIHMPKPVDGVVPLGRQIDDEVHYPLIEEDERYLLWGFNNGPKAMTDTGRQVFVNTVWHMLP